MSQAERKAKIDSTHCVSVSRQCRILSISRSSVYYRPQGTDERVNQRLKLTSHQRVKLTSQIDQYLIKFLFFC